MLQHRQQAIQKLKTRMAEALPLEFEVEAWATDFGAKFWCLEIRRRGRILCSDEFDIAVIEDTDRREALIRGIQSHMPTAQARA